jgi:hypothetical protein
MNFNSDTMKIHGKVNKPIHDPTNGQFVLDTPTYDSKPEIPNMEFLTNQLVEILLYINTDSMNDMRRNDIVGFKTHIQNKFEEFSEKYYGLLEMILNENINDITPLLQMLSIFNKTTPEKLNSDFESYKETVAEKYLYPTFGGKNNYEKKMKEEIKKSKNKKK